MGAITDLDCNGHWPGGKNIKQRMSLLFDSTMPPPFLAVISFLLLISFLKFIHKIIWIPLRIQYHFKKQGITGPSYRPISGNLGELRRLYAAAQSSKSMPYHRSGQGSKIVFDEGLAVLEGEKWALHRRIAN
ncbi:hypothetical protein POTOM_026897 [Populus tomentosa]|uniref:Uncharacterized protein n=1 Tax=Populus tomentosa TaxID=118781 RepID=A0A8X7ZI05_POPTO|nr:hypothetical protein POTOM_026897 [Populus tomentosa]